MSAITAWYLFTLVEGCNSRSTSDYEKPKRPRIYKRCKSAEMVGRHGFELFSPARQKQQSQGFRFSENRIAPHAKACLRRRQVTVVRLPAVTDPAYRRGVDYLLKNQQADGSWYVRTRALGFQPFFETTFPHGVNQSISAAATGWSTMALLLGSTSPASAATARAGDR